MAYPRKIETRIEAVIKDLSRGFPIKQAARRQGFTDASLHDYMKQNPREAIRINRARWGKLDLAIMRMYERGMKQPMDSIGVRALENWLELQMRPWIPEETDNVETFMKAAQKALEIWDERKKSTDN